MISSDDGEELSRQIMIPSASGPSASESSGTFLNLE